MTESRRLTDAESDEWEARLAHMTPTEVVLFYNSLEVGDPRADTVAGEMERRGIDN